MSDLHPASPVSAAPAAIACSPLAKAEFIRWAALGAVLVGAVAAGLTAPELAPVLVALAVYGFGLALTFALLARGFPHLTMGLCNAVTLMRMALSASLVAPLVMQPVSGWAVFGVAAFALALDGADGWLARRQGRASDFGARFDMEVDSALALILALNAFVSGSAGAVVLLIALPRYGFMLAAMVLPWMNRPLPESLMRKAVCVVQVGALVALQPQVLPGAVASALVAVAAAALIWSFGRDVGWLWRARG